MNVARLSIALLLLASVSSEATDGDSARDWLSEIQKLAINLPPGGVYASYQQYQLSLSQAMAYAALGDVEKVSSLLPAVAERAEWQSGGDGMVRQLLAGLEIEAIHKILIAALMQQQRVSEAAHYCQSIEQNEGLFYWLGRHLNNIELLPARDRALLTPNQQASLQFGVISNLLLQKRIKQATLLYRNISKQNKDAVLDRLIQNLMMDGQSEDLHALLALGARLGEPRTDSILYVVSTLVREGKVDEARVVIELVEPAPELMLIQLALGYVAAERMREAGALFDTSHSIGREWESVAITLNRNDWLLAYYKTITDPWRRAERMFQSARRITRSGGTGADAETFIQLAAAAAKNIPSPPTRSLAFQLLVEYYAETGDIGRAREAIESVTEPMARQKALAQVPLALILDGKTESAINAALKVEDEMLRIDALLLAARAARDQSSAYQAVLDAARKAVQSIRYGRQQRDAWNKIVTTQIDLTDISGAEQTVRIASGVSHGTSAAMSLAKALAAEGAYEQALRISEMIPSGMDPTIGNDPRQDTIKEIVVLMAASGDSRGAYQALDKIEHPNVRDMASPPVARALAADGDIKHLTDLVATIKRNDALGDIMSVILYELAKANQLPSPTLLDHIPDRMGGRLCWAAAAASRRPEADLTEWLTALKPGFCKAFAGAGAAFALHAPTEWQNPSSAFGLVDPARVSERMTTAMQKQYNR